jgi:hypothetical protein
MRPKLGEPAFLKMREATEEFLSGYKREHCITKKLKLLVVFFRASPGNAFTSGGGTFRLAGVRGVCQRPP